MSIGPQERLDQLRRANERRIDVAATLDAQATDLQNMRDELAAAQQRVDQCAERYAAAYGTALDAGWQSGELSAAGFDAPALTVGPRKRAAGRRPRKRATSSGPAASPQPSDERNPEHSHTPQIDVDSEVAQPVAS